MTILDNFISGLCIKKAPADEGAGACTFQGKVTNISANSQTFEQDNWAKMSPEARAAFGEPDAPPTASSAMERDLTPVTEDETQSTAAPMPIYNTEQHVRKKKSLHGETQLPLWGMPEFFQHYCRNVVETYQCPLDFVLGAMFTAVSTAIGNKVIVRTPKYTNSLSLWMVAVSPSGANKSEPIAAVLSPLIDINNEYAQEYEEQLEAQSEEKEPPKIRRILLNDCTPEARIETLKNNPNGVLLYVDELASFFLNLTRYNQNAGVTDLLSVYDGRGIQVDRKNGLPITITKSFLNMFGTMQPEIVADIFSKKAYLCNGCNQRIMFLYPESVDFPPLNDAIISDEWREAWSDAITMLRDMEPCDFVLHRDAEAYDIYYKYHTKLQNLKKEATAMGDNYLSSIYSKLQIQVLRLAGIVHAMWCATGAGYGTDITPGNMAYAIECMRYFEYTAKKVMNMVLPDNAGCNINNMQLIKLLYERFEISLSNREMANVLKISHTTINNARKIN